MNLEMHLQASMKKKLEVNRLILTQFFHKQSILIYLMRL